MIDNAYNYAFGKAEFDKDIIKDPFKPSNPSPLDFIKIIQKNERGRQGRER